MAIPNYFLKSEQFTPNIGSIQVLNRGSHRFVAARISPSLPLKHLETTLDFNLFLPLHNQEVNRKDFPFITIRKASYSKADTYSFLLGRVSNVHFGSGLLMDYFDSAVANTPYSLRHMALLAQYQHAPFQTSLFWSLENLYATRLSYSSQANYAYTLGLNIVNDTDGLNYRMIHFPVSRPAQWGFSLDFTLFITPDVFSVYTEFASLHQQGSGLTAGIKGSLVSLFDYQIGLHHGFKGFVPRYFNHNYYSSSFNFTKHGLTNDETGLQFSIDAPIFPRKCRIGLDFLMLEQHEMSHIFITWTAIKNSSARIQLSTPFQGSAYKRLSFLGRYEHMGYDIFMIINQFFSPGVQLNDISLGIEFNLQTFTNYSKQVLQPSKRPKRIITIEDF